jgi:hypothetical protein
MAQSSNNPRITPLCSTVLAHMAAYWTEFAAVRAAARALSHKSCLSNAITVNEVRVFLAAALLSTDRSAAPDTVLSRDDSTSSSGRYACTRISVQSSPTVRDRWRRNGTCPKLRSVRSWMRWALLSVALGWHHCRPRRLCPRRHPVRLSRAMAKAYTCSWRPWRRACLWLLHWSLSRMLGGQFSHNDKCFLPENAVLGPVADRIGLLHGAELGS